MRSSLPFLAALLVVALLATAMRAPAPAVATVPTAADQYTIDSVHSFAVFKIKHVGVSYAFGRFNDITGTFTVDQANPANVSFDVTIKADSIDTGNEKRDGHLKSPDFFNARQFPELTFKSTRVEAAGANAYNVTGDLTIHGETKPVTVKMNLVGAAESHGKMRAGYDTTFTIKRSEFGIDYSPDSLGDEVQIMVSLEGTR